MGENIRFSSWPLPKDKKAKLYWITSPRLNANGNWMLKAVFIDECKKPFSMNLPWGALPMLLLGEYYANGKRLLHLPKQGETMSIFLDDPTKGAICTGYDIPKTVYSMYKDKDLGEEKCWRFKLGNIIYYIPCIELIRSLFAPSEITAHALLKPYGLDELAEEHSVIGDELFLRLSDAYSAKLARRRSTALHLGWLLYNRLAYDAFKAIYSRIYGVASELRPLDPLGAMHNHSTMELRPPLNGPSLWKFRGIKIQNTVLILQLLDMSGIEVPFSEIKYEHRSLVGISKVRTIRRHATRSAFTRRGDHGELMMDLAASGSRRGDSPSEIETEPSTLKFNRVIMVTPVKSRRRSRQAMTTLKLASVAESSVGGDFPDCKVVSLSEKESGNSTNSVEFKSLKTHGIDIPKGLEKFYLAYLEMRHLRPGLTIECTFGKFPEGRSYSKLENGELRPYAVVTIDDGRSKSFILEVSRPDNRNLSTLILYRESQSKIAFELSIVNLLQMLDRCGGTWDVKWLEKNANGSFYLLRHIGTYCEYPDQWGRQILWRVSELRNKIHLKGVS